MVRKFLMLLASVAMLGCGAQPQPVLTPIEAGVPIPTPVYCQVGKLAKPELPISSLRADSAPADTIRAYAATVALLKGAVRQRELLLEGCAAPLGDQAPGAPGTLGTSSRQVREGAK